jgi:hypothetical protein
MSHNIKRERAKRIEKAPRSSLRYLNRLQEQLIAVGAQPNDPLLRHNVNARDAVHNFQFKLHHLSCDGGVGEQ